MKGTGAAAERWEQPPAPSRLEAFAAPGSGPEAREIARRVRTLLDSPDAPPPETIGVVVRELSPERPHGTALRRAFEDAGIPFSGVGLLTLFDGGQPFRFDHGLVLGLPLLLGTLVAFLPPEVTNSFPAVLRPVLGNGFLVGTLTALVLEHGLIRPDAGP
jgi:hypothetical protein